MPFKTPNKTSTYIRELLRSRPVDENERRVSEYADAHTIAALLPETTAFLRQTVRLKDPKRILEIGTAIGYSAMVMLNVAKSAKLYTVEVDEERIATAKRFLGEAGLTDRIVFYCGDSTQIVPNLRGKFDFIFLDGPKAQYAEYLPFLGRALEKGGVLFCDNVLYEGMVSGERETANHKGGLVGKLDLFLHKLMQESTLDSCVLPVGDGVSLSIKLE